MTRLTLSVIHHRRYLLVAIELVHICITLLSRWLPYQFYGKHCNLWAGRATEDGVPDQLGQLTPAGPAISTVNDIARRILLKSCPLYKCQ